MTLRSGQTCPIPGPIPGPVLLTTIRSLLIHDRPTNALSLARPCANDTIFPTFKQEAVFDPDPINDAGLSTFAHFKTCATIPLPPVRLVVHFHDALARSSNDPSRVKHHACDRMVEGECVENRTRSQVPDLVCASAVVSIPDINGTHSNAAIKTASDQLCIVEL